MNVVIDASSIINLENAEVLDTVVQLQRCQLWLTPIVIGECQPTCAARLVALRENSEVQFVDEEQIPADLFLDLLAQHQLGDGETEAIATAKALEFGLCCDDLQARNLARELLGEARVIGSLRLLRWCVEESLFSCGTAFGYFGMMSEAGGFLPNTPNTFFCENLPNC